MAAVMAAAAAVAAWLFAQVSRHPPPPEMALPSVSIKLEDFYSVLRRAHPWTETITTESQRHPDFGESRPSRRVVVENRKHPSGEINGRNANLGFVDPFTSLPSTRESLCSVGSAAGVLWTHSKRMDSQKRCIFCLLKWPSSSLSSCRPTDKNFKPFSSVFH